MWHAISRGQTGLWQAVLVDQAFAVKFADLAGADLLLERVYRGGITGNVSDDPLARLLPVGNQGGFRTYGSVARDAVRLAVLYTTGEEPDWPDDLDVYTGTFTYFGDNRSPGKELHNTQRKGNLLLSRVFERTHQGMAGRKRVPPFLLFYKADLGRDIRFRGLLAPGARLLSAQEDLIAVWRTTKDQRFQNYRATFTVLDVPQVSRSWITQILDGDPLGSECPAAWRGWVNTGVYKPLVAPPNIMVRSREKQLPTAADMPLLEEVYRHFTDRPYDFEQFAADMWQTREPHVDRIEVTRPRRDGGRDAVGDYLLGPRDDPVALRFALEAKCYEPSHGVGVRWTSRLISRLGYRQFGVLVTTSYVNAQAYQEMRDDGHPVVILAGRDLVEILKKSGHDTAAAVRRFLSESYPRQQRS
jgi:hypothetical protein